MFRNILWYLIKNYSDKLDWDYISKNPDFLTEDPIQNDLIIGKYKNKINWNKLSQNPNFLTGNLKKK